MRRNLTRKERLRKAQEIRALFGSSRRLSGNGVRMLCRDNGRSVNRIAIVVTRACGSAVVRNREKRITREAYRDLKAELVTGKDLLFVISRFGQSFSERRLTLRSLFRRASLYDCMD